MQKLIILVLLLSTIPAITFSQIKNNTNSAKDGKISGTITDKYTNTAIEYATVSIRNSKDSSVVSGGITDSKGNFSVNNLPVGTFYLDVTYIGFKKLRINGIGLNETKKNINLGALKLEEASKSLNEVEIVANKREVEYKIDKKLVSISANVVSAGGTAIDALENTPSVQVDIEGNLTLRGSSNFTVLIDGKPSVLSGSDALQQIPASSIQNIEIITNPSAKYDPEGSAGIINIIMKKEKQVGVNGIINASTSTNGSYSSDFLINRRGSKMNLFLGANYDKRIFSGKMHSEKSTYLSADTIYLNTDQNGKFNRGGYGVKAGLDYYINKSNTMSVQGNYWGRKSERNFDGTSHLFRASGITDFYINDVNHTEKDHSAFEGNIDFTHKFNDNGQQIELLANYSNGPGDEKEHLTEDTLLTGYLNAKTYTTEKDNESEFTMQADYTLPLSDNSSFEAGYKGSLDNSSGNYHLFNSYGNIDNFIENTNYNTENTFSNNVQALYATYSGNLKIVNFLAGFRSEYNYRELNQKTINQKIILDKWDFFPSLHLSRKLPWDLQAQASYSRRIRRPSERELDPFETIIDSRDVRVGNPELTPEYTNSYEFSIQKTFLKSGFASGELYRRSTNDLISDYEMKRNDTITVETYKNISHSYSTGFEGTLNLPVTKWWNLNSSVTLYDYKLSSSLSDDEVTDNSSFTWSLRCNSMFRLKWGTQIQLMGFYNGPSITAQGRREAFFFSNIGVRQDMFKKKLTLSVQMRDVLGDNKFEKTSSGSNFYSFYRMKREPRIITFSLTFKINNYKSEKKSKEDMNEMDFDNSGSMN
jgi:outer membrane receptor protein involved in Fe transport